jgi:hypothetical protein
VEVSPSESFAMPQPLNRVARNATFRHNPSALNDKPELARLVSCIFANWALIEHRLSLLLIRILGADAAPAIAMFSVLQTQHLQLAALEAAAESELSEIELEVFQAGLAVANRVQTPRHHLAHWIWGLSPEVPDALCLAEPKSAKERDHELALALERADKEGRVDTAEMARLNTYDTANVQVYRKGDLERANRDLAEAVDITFLVVVYLDGIFRGRRKPVDRASAALTRGSLSLQLFERRLFCDALDQIRKGRKKYRRSTPGSRRSEPAP